MLLLLGFRLEVSQFARRVSREVLGLGLGVGVGILGGLKIKMRLVIGVVGYTGVAGWLVIYRMRLSYINNQIEQSYINTSDRIVYHQLVMSG